MLDKIYIGNASGIAEKMHIDKAYMGDENGIARLIYQSIQSISAAVITLGAALTYDGVEQTQMIESVVLNGVTLVEGVDYTVSGNSGTNAGSYTLTVTGIGDYAGTVTKPWNIAVRKLAKPTVSGSFTYSGSIRSCTVSDMNSAYITQTGTTSATDAGTYTVTFTLKSTSNTQWDDGTTAAVSRTWSIAKAAGSISVSPTSLSVKGAKGSTATATITYIGDGGISVSSSKTSVATVSRSGETITVKSVATGSATITITLAEGTNYTGASCTIAVSMTVYSTVLNSNSWAIIREIAAAGQGANYWSVGDRKAVKINGTFGQLTLSNKTYYAYILGFNHNASIEGNGIQFQFGFTAASGGVNVAFVDSDYENVNYDTTPFRMNKTNTASGGWEASEMRTTICPEFLNCLPSDLRSVIASTTKYTDNTGSAEAKDKHVTSTLDEIFLPAHYEVIGATDWYANPAEENYLKQYDYYANGNSAKKYQHSSTGSACRWWTRSPRRGTGGDVHDFCHISEGGGPFARDARYSFGFAPCFRVA